MPRCIPSIGRCTRCGRFGCRKVKRVSPQFIEDWGIEHLLLTGMVVSNGAEENPVFFWSGQALDMCRELITEIRG